MSAHTAGPWEIEVSEDGSNHNIIPVASNGCGWVGDRYMRAGGCIDIHDAQLIAAAPDLLTALNAMLEYTAELNANQGMGDDHPAVNQASYAIAKATGGAA